MILGIKKEVAFEEKTVRLQKGDVLVIYTDGVTEAQNETGELFGSSRLCQMIESIHDKHPDEMIERILKEVDIFCNNHPLEDDISLVIMKVV